MDCYRESSVLGCGQTENDNGNDDMVPINEMIAYLNSKNIKVDEGDKPQVIQDLYDEAILLPSPYSSVKTEFPLHSPSFNDDLDPFFTGAFKNGASFLGNRKEISDKDIIGIVVTMGSLVTMKGDGSPFSKTVPASLIDFACKSRQAINVNGTTFKIIRGCQRAVMDPSCPSMVDESFSLFRMPDGEIGIYLHNYISASMKQQQYHSHIAFTSTKLLSTMCKCKHGCKAGTDNKITCIHNLPLALGVSLLFYKGFGQHFLIELANRWDENVEKLVDQDTFFVLTKCIKAMMRTAKVSEDEIKKYTDYSTITDILNEFNVGTEKEKLQFHPKPTLAECIPIRFMQIKSNDRLLEDAMLGIDMHDKFNDDSSDDERNDMKTGDISDGESDTSSIASLIVREEYDSDSESDDDNACDDYDDSSVYSSSDDDEHDDGIEAEYYEVDESLFAVEDVGGKPRKSCIRSVTVNQRSLNRLKPGSWLDDSIINFYFPLLKNQQDSSCVFYSSYFFEKLLEEMTGFRFENVTNWNKSQTNRIFDGEIERLFIPINQNRAHWALLLTLMKEKAIIYYDSKYPRAIPNKWHTGRLRYLKEMARKNKKKFDESEWRMYQADVPQQSNNNDCGVFVCAFAYHLFRNHELNFTQNAIFTCKSREVLCRCIREKCLLEPVKLTQPSSSTVLEEVSMPAKRLKFVTSKKNNRAKKKRKTIMKLLKEHQSNQKREVKIIIQHRVQPKE